MTPTALQRLKDAERAYKRNRYVNVPSHAVPSNQYTDKTANGLTRCIVDYIRFTGGMAERVSNMGRPIKIMRGYKWIPGAGRSGTADIHATIAGRTVMIEVKIGRDVQSVAQVRYAADIIRAGGRYLIVKSFEDFLNQLEP